MYYISAYIIVIISVFKEAFLTKSTLDFRSFRRTIFGSYESKCKYLAAVTRFTTIYIIIFSDYMEIAV